MRNLFKTATIYILIALVILLLVDILSGGLSYNQLWNMSEKRNVIYSELINDINDGKVSRIILSYNNVSGQYKDGTKFDNVFVPSPDKFLDQIQPAIESKQIEIVTKEPPQVPWWLSTFLPMLIFAGLMIFVWIFMLQQTQGGGSKIMSFTKSRAKTIQDLKKKVTFADVAGADEEKEELKEVIDFLKNPRKYIELGARIPKGILLVGPPGTGKTLLAKAVAGEAGVPFFSISGSDFVEMFVGVGAARVRDLFDQAKRNAPCVVFIDEIDAVGRHRGAGLGGGHDEREQTLNQLLVEMDGFGTNEGIIVMAATNRPDILDPALLRPGRFDRQIVVNIPDAKAREEILKVHARNKPLGSDVDLSQIAKITAGFTGADLENLLNEAALLAARKGKKQINMEEVQEAVAKVLMGPEKRSRVYTEKEKKLTAYHEAGHAIVRTMIPDAEPVHEVSIIPRGYAGGYTMYLPKEDKFYASKSDMMREIITLLGGRVAEKLVLEDVSTGASSDIKRATKIARDMVTKYGMSDKLGPMTFGTEQEEVFLGRDLALARNYSEEVAAEIDREIKSIIEEAYKKAEEILKQNIDKLHKVANALLEKEKLTGEEFRKLVFEDAQPQPA
ncbi:ATP-dependent metallopeptidase FtsH/Yme1/Tma family protein [Caldicellulosiruptor changbaiensis]|uniref:ATP-dependent zinc metalloprotease FtsH n=2 Tax=Caldicellulosiruptor TaxID=44000 RepID=A4XIS8_CALS8|nr:MULTISPECIES: ATP-dependent zinc metalloprotease FtsH [Caldicellulosiruptor]ABP66813.1 ATP-dependent metalloprotease FtsH [Caldicellulosiruptor saccharolyticus DSM 8903]AZT89707.1 ATP-dependent metallopeptidase FtsH/Yme1/Tma family protein [Caldicellulosiruptor changbaiensis]